MPLLFLLTGCAHAATVTLMPSKPPPAPPLSAPALPPASNVDTLVLGGPDAVHGVSKTPSGVVIVRTSRALLRFSSAEASEATIVPFPEPSKESVTAANADVTAILGEGGELYLARAQAVEKIAHVEQGSELQISADGRLLVVNQREGTVVYDVVGRRLRVVPSAVGRPFGFLGERAVFVDDSRGIVSLVDGRGAKTTVKTCAGFGVDVDRVTGRVVQVCGRDIVIVNTATAKKMTLTMPVSENAGLVNIGPVASRDRIRADFALPDSGRSWSLDIDPRTGRVTAAPPTDLDPLRHWDGVDERPEVTSPVPPIRASNGRVFVDHDNVSLPWARFGADDQPLAPPTMLGIVPNEALGCPTNGAHASLETGELWYDTTDKRACICDAATCHPLSKRKVIGGGGDALIEMNGQEIHVTDLEGHERGVIPWAGGCRGGLTRRDGKVASVRCRHSGGEPESLLELDLATGKHTRTTPLPTLDIQRSRLVALGDASVFLESNPSAEGDYLLEVEAVTGRVLATIYPSHLGGIVRFPDGRVEIKAGEGSGLEDSVMCVENGIARPFATCKDRMLVDNRYRVAH